MNFFGVLDFFVLIQSCLGAKILLIGETNDTQLMDLFQESKSNNFEIISIEVDHDQEDAAQNTSFCGYIGNQAISAVVDFTWSGWMSAQQISQEIGVPYLRVEVSNAPFVEAADNFLSKREAIDAALVFETEAELDQSLYFIIGNYELRILVLSLDDTSRDPYERLKKLRPIPTAFVGFGTAKQLSSLVDNVAKNDLLRRDSRWNFLVEDFDSPAMNTGAAAVNIVVGSMSQKSCCGLKEITGGSATNCNCGPGIKPKQIIAQKAGQFVSKAIQGFTDVNYACGSPQNNQKSIEFIDSVKNQIKNSEYKIKEDTLYFPLEITFTEEKQSTKQSVEIGKWNPDDKMVMTDSNNYSLPRLFRIGMVPSAPWMFLNTNTPTKDQLDPNHKNYLKDKNGNSIVDGYCVELLKQIATKLNFEYEIILSSHWNRSGFEYGRKNETTGKWTGLIGDLASGDIDIVIADLTMTSEREEIIDYVSPYFDQAGISIVLRKKKKEQSLFKFLQVLKPEVWLGILGAVFATAILIWFLERFSPYSARNNRDAYVGPVRIFTLKESFWFALTSLTPQGGGEAPKALSGRVLVAAYWLFVVLMLATFTANLAAFLTVERMQTQLQGLEELARQSRINYTTVVDTVYYDYFANMASAEEELYQKWKELSLNGSDNPAKYRVWDYPIREQYTHILQVINDTVPVNSADIGFAKVREHTEGNFALIHDAARIKYEVYNDCDLVEIGEAFADQPYALAVQQGSHLQELLSKVILELQKDRYFETLQGRYWNSTMRNNCPVLDDSEGITLQSLGGVFIATVVGLTIAMITLAVEVYNKKKLQNGKIGNEAMDKSHIKTIDIKPYKEDVDIFMKKTLDSMNRIE